MERRIDQIFIYILTNKRNGTLYVGLTTNLIKRMDEHKGEVADSFSKKYGLKSLVYYEIHEDIEAAAHRERLLKKWKRDWKIELIEKGNPDWRDLYEDVKKKVN